MLNINLIQNVQTIQAHYVELTWYVKNNIKFLMKINFNVSTKYFLLYKFFTNQIDKFYKIKM